MFLRIFTVVACLRITSPYTKFHDEFLNMKSPFEFGEVGVAELDKEAERTTSNLSGKEERGQWVRAANGHSEREPKSSTQDSQGDQGDSSDGHQDPQAKSKDGQDKNETREKLLNGVNKATEAITAARRQQNQRSANIVRGFGANAVFEPAGIFIMEDVDPYVPESLLRFAPVIKTIHGYMGRSSL